MPQNSLKGSTPQAVPENCDSIGNDGFVKCQRQSRLIIRLSQHWPPDPVDLLQGQCVAYGDGLTKR